MRYKHCKMWMFFSAAILCAGSLSYANDEYASAEATTTTPTITVSDNATTRLPLSTLTDIAILTHENHDTQFIHYCKLYAPVAVSKKAISDASATIIPVSEKTSVNNVKRQLSTASGNIVVVLFTTGEKADAVTALLAENKKATVINAGNDSDAAQILAAQMIFGGVNLFDGTKVIPANRLGYATPEAVGINANIENIVDSLANLGLDNGAYPGCQILMARKGKIFLNKNYGYTDPDKKHEVDDFTIYDLASVSKTTGTLPGIMLAYDRGMIALDSPVSTYISQLRGTDKDGITVKELLFHESGMRPSISLYDVMINHDSYTGTLFSKQKDKLHNIKIQKNLYGNRKAKLRTDIISKHRTADNNIQIANNIWGSHTTYDSIMHRIYTTPLRADKSYAYSCLNFCLLMNIEENVTGISHDTFVTENIYTPLGAYHTGYRPLDRFEAKQIAPTEYDALLRGQKLHGYTHDELACFSGGVQGNAGLFSNATDLAKLCQMWLNGGTYGGTRILSEATTHRFTTEVSPTCRRGLGFDKPDTTNPKNSPTCEEADPTVYGHTGYTGTIFWVDPRNEVIFIFLCNRVNPTRDSNALYKFNIRAELFRAIYNSIQQ